MHPDWLLPREIPPHRVRSKFTHQPMRELQMAGIGRANKKRKKDAARRRNGYHIPTLSTMRGG